MFNESKRAVSLTAKPIFLKSKYSSKLHALPISVAFICASKAKSTELIILLYYFKGNTHTSVAPSMYPGRVWRVLTQIH